METTEQPWQKSYREFEEALAAKRQDASDWIDKFIIDNPIRTGGAISQYKISKTEPDGNGDALFCLTVPFWSQNKQVVSGVLAFLSKLNEEWPYYITIYPESQAFVVSLCYHACDPD